MVLDALSGIQWLWKARCYVYVIALDRAPLSERLAPDRGTFLGQQATGSVADRMRSEVL